MSWGFTNADSIRRLRLLFQMGQKIATGLKPSALPPKADMCDAQRMSALGQKRACWRQAGFAPANRDSVAVGSNGSPVDDLIGSSSTSCRASGPPVTSNQMTPNSHPRTPSFSFPLGPVHERQGAHTARRGACPSNCAHQNLDRPWRRRPFDEI